MTPQERQLVDQLFDRLATLEREPRDPDAERGIREGLARAPNAVYALVQTALIQDEALRRANARIEELQAAAGGEPREQREQQGSFLDTLRNAMFGSEDRRGSGSVPSVRPGDSARSDEQWNSGRPMGGPPGYGRGPEPGWQGGPGGPFGGAPGGPFGGGQGGPFGGAPGGGMFGGGGSFLGTAAAAAAGAIGGSLLLNSIRNVMGPAHAGQGAVDPGSISPGGGGAGNSDLAKQAGLEDVGAQSAGHSGGERDAGYGRDAAYGDDSDYDYDDSGADYDGDTDA